MKQILITGEHSYIGTSLARYLRENHPEDYRVELISLRDDRWRERSFAGYDAVLHAAGLAHRRERRGDGELYDAVNCRLALAVAQKARDEGVGQFVFLSSLSVYGMEEGVITPATAPAPRTHYGQSKLRAEQGLAALEEADFRVCILRPPMVYGKGCPGNFPSLVKLVGALPVFPKTDNARSMVYIDTLCAFIQLCFRRGLTGVYVPRDREPMKISAMAEWIAQALGKPTRLSPAAGAIARLCRPLSPKLRKVFGSLVFQGEEAFSDLPMTAPEQAVKESV